MTFNPNIPQATDLLSDSQGQLQSNNQALNTTFSRNHIALNVATDNGKHKFVEMPVSSGIPTPVPGLSGTSGTVYTRTVAGESQLFYTAGSTGRQYQLTFTDNSTFSKFSTNTTYQASGGSNAQVTGGWTFLPGGMILNYGSATDLNPGGSKTIKFAKAFPNACFSVTCTPRTTSTIGGGNHDWDVSNVIVNQFNLVINGNYNSSDTFYFFAVGN